MSEIAIRSFRPGDEQGVIDVILPIQREEFGLTAGLLDVLMAHASDAALKTILLGTTDKFLAAHRFYEKNGFAEIAARNLPENFPRMAVDTKFYRRAI